jgi:hypothetical protein
MDKAKDAVGDLKDNENLARAEDAVEGQAEKEGALGDLADKADEGIDKVQGSQD